MLPRLCYTKTFLHHQFTLHSLKLNIFSAVKFPKLDRTLKFTTLGLVSGLCFYKFACNPFLIAKCEQKSPFNIQRTFSKPNVSDHRKFAYIWELIVPDYLFLIAAVVTSFIAAVMNIYIPLHLGVLVDVITRCGKSRSGVLNEIRLPALKLCTCYIIQSLCTFLYIGSLGTFGERMAGRIYRDLFRKLIHQDVAYFDVHNAGKLIDNMSSDVRNFKSSFKQCVSLGLRNGTQVIGSVCSLLLISPTLTATILGCLPLIFLIGTLMGTELRRLSGESQSEYSKAISIAEETFSHIHTVKSLTLEDYLLCNYQSQTEIAKGLSTKLAYGIGVFQGLSNLAVNGVVLGVLYVGGHLVSNGQLNPGSLVAFLACTQTLQRSLTQLSLLYGQIVRGITAFSRIYETLNLPDGISNIATLSTDSFSKITKSFTSPPEIQFNNIQFAYPSRPDTLVFNDLNMKLPAGKVIALVGQSGAGKSTIVSLLERFYDPSRGTISLDGYSLKDFNVNNLRNQIGYISQEPQIFNTTVRENIRLGLSDATDAQVEEAAKLAHAHEFIVHDLPYGYDTIIGQGSGTVAGLSGGQRQRIAIARVLLKNAQILLMDEATSALDAESEAKVQAALDVAMKGRTVVIIAHRLSTIRRADLILLMSHGQIVEQGTHDQLIAKRGGYYDLVQKQEGQEFF